MVVPGVEVEWELAASPRVPLKEQAEADSAIRHPLLALSSSFTCYLTFSLVSPGNTLFQK